MHHTPAELVEVVVVQEVAAAMQVVPILGFESYYPRQSLLKTYQANTTPYVAKPRKQSAVSRWFHEAKDTLMHLRAL